MKGARAFLVGLVVLAGLAVLYLGSKYVSEESRTHHGKVLHLSALFHDATGLVDKSRVQIAGIDVGTIYSRELQGQLAKVTIAISPGEPIWSNAILYKRSASLLGQYYLDIDPGTPTSIVNGVTVQNRQLHDWDWITRVSEPTTTDQIMRQVSATVPILQESLRQINDLLHGPIAKIATDVDQTTRDLDDTIRQNQETVADALDRIDRIAANIQNATGGTTAGDIHDILDKTRDVVAQLDTAVNKADLPATAQSVRDALARISASVDQVQHTVDNLSQITDTVRSGQGTVGELLENPDVADNVAKTVSNTAELTGDAAGFVHSITRFQTIVGLRSEYNILERSMKSYVQIVLAPRPDKYYLIELVADPRGVFSNTTDIYETCNGASCMPTGSTPVKVTTLENANTFAFTFQFAKVIDNFLTLRFGIKESTGGVGMDLALTDRFALYTDLFDVGANTYPRLKVLGAYRFFEQLYLVGGIDDILNATNTNDATRPGRDYFFGAWLRFNDEDLKGLLTIGGSSLLAGSGGSSK